MKKLILLLMVAVATLGLAMPLVAQTFASQPNVVDTIPYTPIPSPSGGFSQQVLMAVLGALLPWLVIIIRWGCSKLGWELSGSNAKLLVGVLSAVFTVVVMVIYGAFGDVHGWALVMAIITNLGIIIGMAELVYGQIISRIPPTAKLAAAQKSNGSAPTP